MTLNRVFNWATLPTYNYGGFFDGGSTELEPSATLRANGWIPGTRPSPQHLNHVLQSEIGAWLRDILKGWIKSFGKPTVLESGAPGIMLANAIAFGPQSDGGLGRWFVVGSDPTVTGVISSSDGYVWKVETTVSSGAVGPPSDICCHPSSDQVVTISNAVGALRVYRRNTSAVWSDNAGPSGKTTFNRVIYSPTFGGYLIGSKKTADNKPFIDTSTDAVTWTERTLTGAAATAELHHIADSGSKIVAIDNAGSGTLKGWTSTNGTSWTEITSPSTLASQISGTVRALAYDSVLGVFVLTTSTHVYTSTDGTTWTSVSTTAGDFVASPRCLVCEGGVFVSASGTTDAIKYSIDAGVTWESAPRPRGTGTGSYYPSGLAKGGGRLAFCAYQGASNKSDVSLTYHMGN